jgi:hypothetical protein
VHQATHAIGADRQIVRIPQPAQHLAHRVDDDRERQSSGVDDAVEVLALDQLHHEVEAALVIAIEVEHRHHVRVLHPRRQLRFTDEHLREDRVARRIGQHALDGDRALEALGADRVAAEHLRHAAHPQRRVEHVLPQPHAATALPG